MTRIDDQLFRRLKYRAAEQKRREREALNRLFDREEEQQQPRPSLHIVVHEYSCPDCKHRMWSEDVLAKNVECTVCGFRGDFKKRED